MVENHLTFDAFARYLRAELHLGARSIVEDSYLLDDLELDSLQIYEMLAAIEELGVFIPDEAMEVARTLGDVYHFYQQEELTIPGNSDLSDIIFTFSNPD